MTPQRRIRAVFMRGGTSNAVIFRGQDLPADRADWDLIFCAVLGSPDRFGRQLDGMGGGISSLSKVCVVAPSDRPDADVDYTFGQVAVDAALVDYAGNCGNMSSAIGPFAVDEGMVAPPPPGQQATVRIFNTNTQRVIVAHFDMDGTEASVDGSLAIDGVHGSGAPVRLDFLSPGGTKTGRLLPTGHPMDVLDVPGLGPVPASLVDAGNPCVFVPAAALGVDGTESPDELEAVTGYRDAIEAVRRQGAVAMGMADQPHAVPQSIPKVAIVRTPIDTVTLDGRTLPAAEVDLLVRMMSMGRVHRAVPVTGALCVAAACRIPGTIPTQELCAAPSEAIRIGHPSGALLVDAQVTFRSGDVFIETATLYRTARRLFEGNVLIRS